MHQLTVRSELARRGFSLIELMVVIAMIGIMLTIAIPAFSTWSGDSKVRATAESVLGGLRVAQANAVAHNRIGLFALTAGSPGYTATPAANGGNWFVALQPLVTDDIPATIQASAVATQYGVSIVGPAMTCFNTLGQSVYESAATANGAAGVQTVCNQSPVATATYTIKKTSGAVRQYKVLVTPGGQIRMCDALKTLSNANPDGCP